MNENTDNKADSRPIELYQNKPKCPQNKPKCPACGSTWTMYLALKDSLRCRTCGQEFVRDSKLIAEGDSCQRCGLAEAHAVHGDTRLSDYHVYEKVKVKENQP